MYSKEFTVLEGVWDHWHMAFSLGAGVGWLLWLCFGKCWKSPPEYWGLDLFCHSLCHLGQSKDCSKTCTLIWKPKDNEMQPARKQNAGPGEGIQVLPSPDSDCSDADKVWNAQGRSLKPEVRCQQICSLTLPHLLGMEQLLGSETRKKNLHFRFFILCFYK